MIELYESDSSFAEDMTLEEILSLYRNLYKSNKNASLVFHGDEVLISGFTRSYVFTRKVLSVSTGCVGS